MKSILALLSVLLCCSFAHAQQDTPVTAQKISYQRHVPTSVVHLMPHGAKSCFWGTFRLVDSGPIYGVHLFNPNPKQGQTYEGFGDVQEFKLDIFSIKSGSAERINRLAVNYPSLVWGVSKFGAAWTWVDPKCRQVPVLRFDIWSPDGMYGRIGENVFLSFPQGLKGKAAVQALQFGSWRASDYSGQSNQFVRGDDGRTEIYVSLYPSGPMTPEEVMENNRFTLQWDTKRSKFWPTEKARRVIKNFTYLLSVIEAW